MEEKGKHAEAWTPNSEGNAEHPEGWTPNSEAEHAEAWTPNAERPAEREFVPMRKPGCQMDWAVFHELARFARNFGPPRAFRDWGQKLIDQYLLFHLRQQTLVWCYEPGHGPPGRYLSPGQEHPRVLALGIAWPDTLRVLKEREAQGGCMFEWEPADWGGADSVYLAEWVVRPGVARRTEQPTGREAVRLLARTLWVRWPEQRGKPIFYQRRGKLKRLDGKTKAWAGVPEEEELIHG